MSHVRDLAEGRSRFANDSRGIPVQAAIATTGPASTSTSARWGHSPKAAPRLESGFIGFDFHPEFAKNRAVLHRARRARDGQPGDAELHPSPGTVRATSRTTTSSPSGESHQSRGAHVSREPGASCCEVAHVVANLTHPMGFVVFEPDSQAGRGDRRLRPPVHERQRFAGLGSGGGPIHRRPETDPTVGLGDWRDPEGSGNPAQSVGLEGHEGSGRLHRSAGQSIRRRRRSEDAGRDVHVPLRRDTHRISWDSMDGTMYASDIGMNQESKK